MDEIFDMISTELRMNFHKLIDEIQNEVILNQFYEILINKEERVEGKLWQQLTLAERQELIETERESHKEEDLILHDEMIVKNSKWL